MDAEREQEQRKRAQKPRKKRDQAPKGSLQGLEATDMSLITEKNVMGRKVPWRQSGFFVFLMPLHVANKQVS
jgi:hypothetical protein